MSPARRLHAGAWALGIVLALASPAAAQTAPGTGFTYQGRLLDGGSPASGVYDLQFTLYDAPSAGSVVGSPLRLDDVAVAGGLFTVALDFGPGAFTGSARWLEIGVRPGSSTGAFTLVGPRQEVKPAPYAIFATGAGGAPWAGITAKPPGFADDVDNDSGGDITGVTAGTGLTGGGPTGSVTLGVDFTGSSGTASAAARTDHHHLSQTWNATGGTGLTINNTGTALSGESSVGTALIGHSTSAAGVTNGVWGRNLSTNGRGVYGQAFASSGTTYGVYGTAGSPDGTGVFGKHLATTGTEAGVTGETDSTSAIAAGVLGQVTSTTPGASSTGVRGINNGTGPLGIGVWGSHAGSGWGVNGTTVSGIGVRGAAASAAGVGVRATGFGPTGTALEISGGAIRVAGAGEGTATPVFVHVVTTANSCGSPELHITAIDHPLANGDPDAILIATARGANAPFWLLYGNICGFLNRWGIVAPGGFSDPFRFNVLVVKP